MQPAIAWLIAGLLIVAVELMTGTFYLLIIGIAALIGSLIAYLGQPVWLQALIAAIAAVVGGGLVHRYHRAANATSPKDIDNDVGHTVTIESWVNEPKRLARVRYRGTTWDAEVVGDDPVALDALLYVVATEGSRLKVSPTRARG
jgi:membrane protein implicated in regulation of membrane protease activity